MFNLSAQSMIVSRVEDGSGEGVYVAPRNTGTGTQFRILAQKNGNDWVPVTKLQASVDRFSFQTDYAFLPCSSANGNSGYSVETPGLNFKAEDNTYTAGEELEIGEDGRVMLHSRVVKFPEGHKVSSSERSEILEYHYDDSHWAVGV